MMQTWQASKRLYRMVAIASIRQTFCRNASYEMLFIPILHVAATNFIQGAQLCAPTVLILNPVYPHLNQETRHVASLQVSIFHNGC